MNLFQKGRTFWMTGILLTLACGTANLQAESGDDIYRKATELYRTGHYRDAVPYLETLAQKGDKAAMYRLAHLYEEGLGVKQDYKKAAYWYKRAAKQYAYTVENQKTRTQYPQRRLHRAV